MTRLTLILMSGWSLAACTPTQIDEPRTLGEVNTGYNYIPVDPLEVSVLIDNGFPNAGTAKEMQAHRYRRCVARAERDDPPARPAGATVPAAAGERPRHGPDVMDALPDHTIRMAMRSTSGGGEGGFGPVTVSAKGTSYQVVMDSIFADTANVRFGIRVNGGDTPVHSLQGTLPAGTRIEVIRLRHPSEKNLDVPFLDKAPETFEEVTIPMYVGVGLRLTARLHARKGNINLASLPAVGVSADAEESSGSLTMQTLGVFNQQVASTFALPTELSSASVQNALVSMGAVKAIVYDRDTGTRPRLTGIYNPLGTSDPALINKIYSALALRPIPWAACGSS